MMFGIRNLSVRKNLKTLRTFIHNDYKLRNEHKHCKSRLHYTVSYIVIIFLLFFSLLSFGLCLITECQIVTFIREVIFCFLQPKAMATVVNLVGLTGVVLTWLISRTEDRILGVQMSGLIKWCYPHFFQLYFVFFILLSILTVFTGNIGLFWPCFYSFWGTLLAFSWLLRVCYLFVICSKYREDIAFKYHKKQLQHFQNENNCDDKILEALLNTAYYSRFLFEHQCRNYAHKSIEIWIAFLAGLKSDTRKKEIKDDFLELTEEENTLIKHSTLFCSAWEILLPRGINGFQDLTFLKSLLEELDKQSYPIRNNESLDCTYGRMVILLGLAQYLLECCKKKWDRTIESLCTLIYEEPENVAVHELICACATMFSVEWVCGSLKAQKALFMLSNNYVTIFEKMLINDEENVSFAVYLLHAQWIARNTHQLSIAAYLLKANIHLENRGLECSILVTDANPVKQKDLLIALLYLTRKIEPDNSLLQQFIQMNIIEKEKLL